MRLTRKPFVGKNYLLSKKIVSKASLKILEVYPRIMIDFANFNISIMHIFNRFVIVFNIQIIIQMLKYSHSITSLNTGLLNGHIGSRSPPPTIPLILTPLFISFYLKFFSESNTFFIYLKLSHK